MELTTAVEIIRGDRRTSVVSKANGLLPSRVAIDDTTHWARNGGLVLYMAEAAVAVDGKGAQGSIRRSQAFVEAEEQVAIEVNCQPRWIWPTPSIEEGAFKTDGAICLSQSQGGNVSRVRRDKEVSRECGGRQRQKEGRT